MAQRLKISIIGSKGFEHKSKERTIDCYPWDRLDKITNLNDYDDVIINLISIKNPTEIKWENLWKRLNPFVMERILEPRGRIIIFGDPRFSVPNPSPSESDKKTKEKNEPKLLPFLWWTGFEFEWSDDPGDTVEYVSDYNHRAFEPYLQNLKKWDYSLYQCTLNEKILGKMFRMDYLREERINLELSHDRFCVNRYGGGLAFSSRVILTQKRGYYGTKETIKAWGPIIFLPKISLNEEETITLVLRDLCGIETEQSEPEWIKTFNAPGQKEIDDKIATLRTQIESHFTDLEAAQKDREETRSCLKLLYERGEPLEKSVRKVLKGLGAHVEEPENPGMEDGWITIKVDGTTYEGVLEVKSTRNDQFDQNGLRQLLEWKNRGIQNRQKKYKGIFIGNSAVDKPVDKRPYAFSDSFQKSAELSEIVILKTEDLYLIHILSAKGKIKIDEFWKKLFNTNGILNMSEYFEAANPASTTLPFKI